MKRVTWQVFAQDQVSFRNVLVSASLAIFGSTVLTIVLAQSTQREITGARKTTHTQQGCNSSNWRSCAKSNFSRPFGRKNLRRKQIVSLSMFRVQKETHARVTLSSRSCLSVRKRQKILEQDHLAVKTHAVSQLRCVLHGGGGSPQDRKFSESKTGGVPQDRNFQGGWGWGVGVGGGPITHATP